MELYEFIKQIDIEYVKGIEGYGFAPFRMVAERDNGKLELFSLVVGEDVKFYYRMAYKCVDRGDKKVFLAVDFPGAYDIKHDFVGVLSFINSKLSILAIPYSLADGEKYKIIYDSVLLDKIVLDYNRYAEELSYQKVVGI